MPKCAPVARFEIFLLISAFLDPQLNVLNRGLFAEAADETAKINEDASRSLAAVMETRKLLTQEMAQQKAERIERVKAKLATVMVSPLVGLLLMIL